MTETQRPHTAVLNIMVEVHSLSDNGECSGNIVNSKKLEEYGLKPAFLLGVNGNSMEDCLIKLKEKITRFTNE